MKNVGKFGAKLHDKIKNNFGTQVSGVWVLLCCVLCVTQQQLTASQPSQH